MLCLSIVSLAVGIVSIILAIYAMVTTGEPVKENK